MQLTLAGLDDDITVTLTDDAGVREDSPGQNYGSENSFYIYNYPGHRSYALLKFHLDVWRPGLQVDSASLNLLMNQYSSARNRIAVVELLDSDDDWSEDTVT